jgi:hypothetical protein
VPPNRTITEEPLFRQELLAIEPDPKAADALLEGPIWVLSRDPQQGQHIGGHYSLTWYFTIARPGKSQLVLYYAFDDKEVLLVSIQVRS